jgi:hypothetical protein
VRPDAGKVGMILRQRQVAQMRNLHQALKYRRSSTRNPEKALRVSTIKRALSAIIA